MNVRIKNFPNRRASGYLLEECLVYIAVFALLLGIGTAAFYYCWDHSRALTSASEEVLAALRAGEHWRADVRAATGKILVEQVAQGELVRIPENSNNIIYRFEDGELVREIPNLKKSQVLLHKVKVSQMKPALRGSVNAWVWELELKQRIKSTHQPMLFTFEAVAVHP